MSEKLFCTAEQEFLSRMYSLPGCPYSVELWDPSFSWVSLTVLL